MKPHQRVSTTPLSNWCVNVLKEAGAELNILGSHSTRSAVT